MRSKETIDKGPGLKRYMSPITAWALAFGSSIGWGAFVMPGTTFLPLAGPMGTVAGIALGAVVMLVIGVSYHYLMNRYPDSGGAFTYVKNLFSYDHGFVCAWFLALTYIAIVWANATALPLIARNLLGGMFQFGFSYEIAGFTVYFGEVLLAICALLIAGFVCLRTRLVGPVQILMSALLVIGVAVCFAGVSQQFPTDIASASINDTGSDQPIVGFLSVVALAPWAFVGFESISHSAGEFRFSPKKALVIMALALVAAAAGYAMLAVIAASAQPAGYENWQAYFADLGTFSGVEGLPAFYVIEAALGSTGTMLVGFAALGGIATGLIGNTVAASRLLYSMASDGMLPEWFAKTNRNGAPASAILFIMGASIIVLFIGRAATSWIVDVTTVGATIAYAYTSSCAFVEARKEGNLVYKVFGALGVVIAVAFMVMFLLPNFLAIKTLSDESYLILTLWSVLGFAFFRQLYKKDQDMRLGRSSITWIVLLSLIMFASLVWVHQSSESALNTSLAVVEQACEGGSAAAGSDAVLPADVAKVVQAEFQKVDTSLWVYNIVQMVLIVMALVFMFDIYRIMQKRHQKAEVERALAEESSRAKTSFLSNMSHEIRTPMNAIIGLDNIALKDPNLSPRTREQLEKIGGSAKHLLGLINDILDMSRIESGRMTLKEEEFAFRDFLDQINVIINGQCQDKGLQYECRIVGHSAAFYVGDDMKLKQVLINILGNAVKFTEAPGKVTFVVEETGHFEGMRTLRFTMQDTGIGMDKEYLPKIFEAFSQEDDTVTNAYGGSGLGMAITKSIVEMMNGEIAVESEKGVGTTFTVTVTLKASSRSIGDRDGALPRDMKVLVVDDDEVAAEHAKIVLSDIGIDADLSLDSEEALNMVRTQHAAGVPYQLVLTDLKMPGRDGIELTSAIRGFDDGETAIIILTGYSFDDVTDEAWAAGADGLLNKPLFTDTLAKQILAVLDKKNATEGELAGIESGEEEQRDYSDLLAGRRVLLAEDIEINADIMMDLLEMEGMEVDHALNGRIVVDMFNDSEPGYYDAILMDVRMPVLDGLSAAREIRMLDRADAKEIPILALTANAFDDDVQRSMQAGMNAHLSKPVEADRLYETLGKFIAERSR